MVYLNGAVEAWSITTRSNYGFSVQGSGVSIGYIQRNKKRQSGGIHNLVEYVDPEYCCVTLLFILPFEIVGRSEWNGLQV